MSRRGGPGLQILIGVVVVGLFLYGFYSYHEVQSRLRTMEEKADRLKVQHESVSAQLQVVYEHKSRLEKTVQDERISHKKTKDDLKGEKQNLEQTMRQEKETLTQEIDRLKSEQDKLEDEKNSAESEKQRVQEELRNLHDSCGKQNEDNQQQINQQRQECDNDVAQLKDEIADLRRRNGDLETKVKNQTKADSIDVDAGKHNKSLQHEEEQHMMQIVEPGDNKPKPYFEVKSPAPVDKKLVNAQLQQQQQNEQVAPPVVKNGDAEDENQPEAAGIDANQAPNEDDNRIKDIAAVTKSRDKNLGGIKSIDKNDIDRIPDDNAVREPVKDDKNVPGQVPPPASKDTGQPGLGAEKLREDVIQNQVAKPDEGIPLGQAAKPGLGNQPNQVNPPGQEVKPVKNYQHGARIPNEDEHEGQQAPNEGQLQNPDAKNEENEQEEEYDDNQDNNAKDM